MLSPSTETSTPRSCLSCAPSPAPSSDNCSLSRTSADMPSSLAVVSSHPGLSAHRPATAPSFLHPAFWQSFAPHILSPLTPPGLRNEICGGCCNWLSPYIALWSLRFYLVSAPLLLLWSQFPANSSLSQCWQIRCPDIADGSLFSGLLLVSATFS